MTMKEIRSKDFDYYEKKAVYFDYTHDSNDIASECSDEYLALNKDIINAIEKCAVQDRIENHSKKDILQLKKYIIEEGLIEKEKIKPVLDELFRDYTLAFSYLNTK